MRVLIWCLLVVSVIFAGCGKSQSFERGATLFAENCAICHGADARGGGGASIAGLSKTPPDLTTLSREAGGTFPTEKVIAALLGYAAGSHPGRRMQPFEDLDVGRVKRVRTQSGRVRIPAAQKDLIQYLETLQR